MDFLTALRISGSGLSVERTRVNLASSNLANAETTSGPDGGPYKRRDVALASQPAAGGIAGARASGADPGVFEVKVQGIVEDQAEPRLEYDPGHPDADARGYVKYPNIDLAFEMVNMMEASRAYEANITTMEVSKAMMNSSLRLIA